MTMLRERGGSPRKRLVLTGLMAVQFGLVGCSGDDNAVSRASTHAVRGSVLLPGGKPLTGGTIHFVPRALGAAGATGRIHDDGTFRLSTYGDGDGAVAGGYKVRVEPDFDGCPRDKKGAPVLPFSPRFTDEDTSEWTAEVQARDNELPPFQLDKKPAGKTTGRRNRG